MSNKAHLEVIDCWTVPYCNCCVNIGPRRGWWLNTTEQRKQTNHNVMKVRCMKHTLLGDWKNLILWERADYRINTTCKVQEMWFSFSPQGAVSSHWIKSGISYFDLLPIKKYQYSKPCRGKNRAQHQGMCADKSQHWSLITPGAMLAPSKRKKLSSFL